MVLLSGKNIEKSYDNQVMKTMVLKGVDIEILEGEFVSIMGKSGSGKSTLLNVLSSLDVVDKGVIYFEEREISKLSEEASAKLRRESFGFIFQLPKMVRNLCVLDNILLPSVEYKKHKEEIIARARSLMKKIDIEHLANHKISQVSGGQLQRVGICRALINNPKILFADEPTGALDSKTTEEVLALFSAFNAEGRSIVMVTHDVYVAARANRVLFMKDGILVDELKLGKDFKENLLKVQEAMNTL